MTKGESKKIIKLEEKGIILSFAKSLNPSAIGCKRPKNPTWLGPLLLWEEARIFLSNKVKKATDNIIPTIKGTVSTRNDTKRIKKECHNSLIVNRIIQLNINTQQKILKQNNNCLRDI